MPICHEYSTYYYQDIKVKVIEYERHALVWVKNIKMSVFVINMLLEKAQALGIKIAK